jgi:hypothetical protein
MSALLPLFQRDFGYLPGDAEIYASDRFTKEYECWIIPVMEHQSFVLFKRKGKADRLR